MSLISTSYARSFSPLTSNSFLLRRANSGALTTAIEDFSNTVLSYEDRLPACAKSFDISIPACAQAANDVTASEKECKVNFATVTNTVDEFACVCRTSEEQNLTPVNQCLEASCSPADATTAKALTKEMTEVGAEKCWAAHKIAEKEAAEIGTTTTDNGKGGSGTAENSPLQTTEEDAGVKVIGKALWAVAVFAATAFGLGLY